MSETSEVRDATPQVGDAAAFADLLSTGWSGASPTSAFLANFGLSADIIEYREGKRNTTSDVTLASESTIAAYIYETLINNSAIFGITISVQKGNAEANVGGEQATVSGIGTVGVWSPTIDISSLAGSDISVTLIPIETAFGSASVQEWTGFSISHRIRRFNATDADNISTEIKSEFIEIGVPSENAFIDFVGTPLSGTSPLAVQFTDISEVNHAYSTWNFGDGNYATFAGETHPSNTYTTDSCSLDLL
jgi:PKD repeat protein